MEILEYDPVQREAFRKGELAPTWATAYPALFDQDDLRLSKSQPTYHYFEWLAAIRIFEDTGYLSLLEKFQFRRHRRKNAIFVGLVPHAVVAIYEDRALGSRQTPDLLCYAPDLTDWYFCEVKADTDHVRATQSTDFTLLERMTGRPVRIIHFIGTDRPSRGAEDDAA